jgi:hypothetical protein
VKQLEPGGVLVGWLDEGLPAFTLGSGKRTRIGGRPAVRTDTAGGICRRIGADRTIDVRVELRPLPSPLLELTACLREPGVAQATSRVDALLASTRFDLSQ